MKKTRKRVNGSEAENSQKVYYRISEIAEKFGISQKAMGDILVKLGIKAVLPGIYDRDSFRKKMKSLKKLIADYRRELAISHIKSPNPDGYMNINEIAELFGSDVSCIRRKINKLKLPFIRGIRSEKRYHDTVIDKYSHILKRGSKVPIENNAVLRSKGYITFSEFSLLAGISRVTLRKRINNGLYTDLIMYKNVAYIHKRNLNIEPVRKSWITGNTPDGYIPLVTIREILNLKSLSIQQYIRDGIINPMYVIRKSIFVYIKREEAEKFIHWFQTNKLNNELKKDNNPFKKSKIMKGVGMVLSDYDIFE